MLMNPPHIRQGSDPGLSLGVGGSHLSRLIDLAGPEGRRTRAPATEQSLDAFPAEPFAPGR
jgi:hypothetical protein